MNGICERRMYDVVDKCQKTHEYMDEADNVLPQYLQIANALKYVVASSSSKFVVNLHLVPTTVNCFCNMFGFYLPILTIFFTATITVDQRTCWNKLPD